MVTHKGNESPPKLYNKYIFNSNNGEFESKDIKANFMPENLKDRFPFDASIFIEKFIKGPIPMPGIVILAHIKSDKILFTVLLIFYLVSFNKNADFKFPYQYSDIFGLSRATVKRHLKKLAELELIELKIEHSKSPRIKVDLKKWGYNHVVRL